MTARTPTPDGKRTETMKNYLDPATDHCEECNGTGEEECSCCGREGLPCGSCLGIRWCPNVLDVGKWDAAVSKFSREHGVVCGWFEGSLSYGLKTLDGKHHLAVGPFLLRCPV